MPTAQTAFGRGPPVPAVANQHNLWLPKADTRSPSFSSGQTKLLAPRSREVRQNMSEVSGGRTHSGAATRRDALRHVPPRSLRSKPPDCWRKLGRSCPSSPPHTERGAAAGETPSREAVLPAARRPGSVPLLRNPSGTRAVSPRPVSEGGRSRNAKRVSQKAKQEEAQKKKGRVRRLLLSKPVDDVYLTWYYERPSYNVEEAVGMLKKFQELDFTYPKQFVYINVTLDMQLQKKKKVDQFASIVLLPYRFTDETNKVLVFTEVSKPELLIYICHEPSMLLCQN
uniref:Uncharacterized protein n=1 Tax=Pavo cristatus TaxID=9049 RepID=A0A8C9FD80_PAVCR